MKRRRTWVGAAFILAVVLGLGYAGLRTWRSSEAQLCQVCSRPIHSHTRTIGLVGSRRESFCCPACALTTHDQNGRAVKIVELTDYATNSALDVKPQLRHATAPARRPHSKALRRLSPPHRPSVPGPSFRMR